MGIGSVLTKFKSKVEKIQSFMNIVFLSALVLFVTIQILLRYVFKSPLLGIEELMIFPTIWLYMMGGASASLEGKHIECGMLDSFVKSPRVLQITVVIKNLISVGICMVLTGLSYGFFTYSLRAWKTSGSLYIPMFFGESSIFICTLLMTIYSLFALIDSAMKYFTYKEGVMQK